MVAVVVDGAEPREDEGALFESPGQFCRTKEAGKGEALSLDENGIDLRNIGETEMAPVTWKEDRLRVRIEGPRSRLELANEKLVETVKRVGGFGKLGGIDSEVPDKGGHEGPAGGTSHAAAVPAGEKRSFDEVSQDGTTGILICKTQPALPVDLLGLEGAGLAIKITDGLHGRTLPLASWARQD